LALAVLVNGRYSGKKVYIRRAMMQLDAAATTPASTTIQVPVLMYRGVGEPTVGDSVATAPKASFKSSDSSDPNVRLYYPATAGGINDSTLAGAPSGGLVWRQWVAKLRSGEGQFLSSDSDILPGLVRSNDWILNPGEYLIVRADAVSLGNNNPGCWWFAGFVWQEEAVPVHAISGTVNNGGSGVVGAKVTVLVADDTSLTNAVLWGVYTTGAGGAWTTPANIPDGKIAYAYAQNYTGGTYYTADGAPYVS
jgi:hypothetical protein